MTWENMDISEQRRAAVGFSTSAQQGKLEEVKGFVAQGVPVNQTCVGMTPLAEAVRNGRLDVVKYLIAAGAKTDNRIQFVGERTTELELAMALVRKPSMTSSIHAEGIARYLAEHARNNGGDAKKANEIIGELDIIKNARKDALHLGNIVGALDKVAARPTGDSHRNTMVHRNGGRVVFNKTF